MEPFNRRRFLTGLGGLGLSSALVPLVTGASAQAALDPMQTQLLRDVNLHFNRTDKLEGDFVQIGPNGERAEGRFYLWKPGRMRFDYNEPSPLLVVANGRWVGISDMKERTTERYPLKATPLKLLLADEVNLAKQANISNISADADLITMVLEEDSGEAIGSLTLMFDTATLELRQWVVTDAQGLDTSVALYNTKIGVNREKKLFVIPDYDRQRALGDIK